MSAIEAPRRMRAAILVAQNHPLVVDEVELPAELFPGQVLVELSHGGICGAQICEIEGVKGEDPHLPHLLGHEGSGRVRQLGPGVTSVRPGDHVVLHWRKGRGIEADPPLYRWNGAPLNAGWVTTFNEYAVVSENRLTGIPRDFPLDLAPLMGCATTTALGVIENDSRLRPGESIVVLGSGGLGLSIVQAAALVSANPIVAVDVRSEKLALARELGATHGIDSTEGGLGARLDGLLGSAGADVVVETTGSAELIGRACELAAPGGRIVLVGVPRREGSLAIAALAPQFGRRLIASHGGGSKPADDIPRCIRLWKAGSLQLQRLITDRVSLEDINRGVTGLQGGSVSGRCLVGLPASDHSAS